MFTKLLCLMIILLIGSSCVSRTTYKKNIEGGGSVTGDSKLVWFWNEDF